MYVNASVIVKAKTQYLQHLTAMLHLAVKRRTTGHHCLNFNYTQIIYINLLLENWNRDFALLASVYGCKNKYTFCNSVVQ